MLPLGSVCTSGVREGFLDLILCFVAKPEFSRCKMTAKLSIAFVPASLILQVCPNSVVNGFQPVSWRLLTLCRSLISAIHSVWAGVKSAEV